MGRSKNSVRAVAAAFAAAMPALLVEPASAQSTATPSAYAYTVPAGWSRTVDGDTEMLSAPKDGAAQILLLAPKPAAGDFDTQFAAERAALEQQWGLRAAAPVAPQRGQAASGRYAAYFASYDSDGGPRYMSFLAMTHQQRLAMVVFVAASHDTFNRLAPVATELFTTLKAGAR